MKTKTYFCVADVHSFYTEMRRALSNEGYNENDPSHIFVSIGDLFDRGSESKECLEFVNGLPKDRKILIRGNHEILMREMVFGGNYPRFVDKHNGTWKTACDLTGVDSAEVMEQMRKNTEWWEYYHSTKYYYVIKDYILTHGWIPCEFSQKNGALKVIPISEWDSEEYEYYWDKTYTWLNGMQLWRDGARINGKTIICGHWNVSWGWKNIRHKCENLYDGDAIHEPFIDEGIIALDACTAASHKVNCFKFTVED